MIFSNIDFHNVSEMTENNRGSYIMRRMPVETEKGQDEITAVQNRNCIGVELRFVAKSDIVKIKFDTFVAAKHEQILVFFGDYQFPIPTYIDGDSTEVVIDYPHSFGYEYWFRQKANEQIPHKFSPCVTRIVLPKAEIYFSGVEGEVEVPCADMYPKNKFVAYGSSITSGSGAFAQSDCFIARVAETLGYDVFDYGYPGACRLDKASVDFLAKQDFDFITMEMGVNILDVAPEVFAERLEYAIGTVAKSNPTKKVYAISPFYCYDDLRGEGNPAYMFRKVFDKVLPRLNLPNVIYINGLDLLGSPEYLLTDYTHPSSRGMEQIANNLLKYLK